MPFKVETDEKFFNRFKELESKLKRISANFQNEDLVLSHEEWENYLKDVSNFQDSLNKLIGEADQRMKLI